MLRKKVKTERKKAERLVKEEKLSKMKRKEKLSKEVMRKRKRIEKEN